MRKDLGRLRKKIMIKMMKRLVKKKITKRLNKNKMIVILLKY